jgi:hypothetical protein
VGGLVNLTVERLTAAPPSEDCEARVPVRVTRIHIQFTLIGVSRRSSEAPMAEPRPAMDTSCQVQWP